MTQESIRVLIIEDDIAIAEVNHKYLSQIDGFEVVGIATSQHEAEIQVDILKPQLVLLDVYLPDGNGLDILRYLRQQQHQCDVILITAARDVDTLQQAMRGGVVDYLLKPVIFSRLESALNKYKHRLTGFEQASSLDQGLVDKMLQTSSVDGEGNYHTLRLPKGIDGVTLDKIRCLFKQESGQLTADEAGEKIGASRTTARRYLEYLITTGELVADLNYGTVGRPERSYKKVIR
ncbi:response regulator [Vibrio algivorus]|uniref:Transcriptional regulatory protein n=1 Tax=Vibrio algivorus TaxID=1667024 RepID=A0A557P755_9VIBR|nr:response regulator [Vibrio algivorus]TVO36493.1 response regulator [Vibrio algivorus]GLT14062.1 transcriptional regulatory protein [Vibrio algivorus]